MMHFAYVAVLALTATLGSGQVCGNVTCGSGSSACVSYQVVRNGTTYSQSFWVNTVTGQTYLPLTEVTAQPFPTIAQVNSGAAYAPNVAIWTVSGARQLTAFSCVHIVINPSSGAAYIDVTDLAFAITRDETAVTYAAGAPNAQYGIGKACSGATTAATLLAGTDLAMGYANVNLSGTAFMVSGTTTQCAGASSCTCSCNCNGPLVACTGWSLWTAGGAGVIKFSAATQSLVILANGGCGGFVPSPNAQQIPLDGVVQVWATPACGGIPCGTAGSACMTLPVTRAGATVNQTFWVSATGSVCALACERCRRPFHGSHAPPLVACRLAPPAGNIAAFPDDRPSKRRERVGPQHGHVQEWC